MKRMVLLSLLIMGGLACERNPKQPGYEFLPEMVHSIPYDSFAKNPVTPDGKTMQAPAVGSIPRGFTPYHYGNTPEEAERAGRELINPVALTPEVLVRGKKVYETFCLVCHGPEGKGDGPLIPKFPNPPSYTSKNVRDYPAGRLFHIITRGSGMMASYASQISPDERWKLVYYVQSLQQPKPEPGQPESGKTGAKP